MDLVSVIVFSMVFAGYGCREQLRFPAWFKFGAASSAYQVEGAWNVSDKGLSTWDKSLHENASLIRDKSNGDVACDSYRLWRRDIQMCQELGLDMYRFSISWSRLLPTGFTNEVSEAGRDYYSNLIDGLLANGIEPIVTIYHFDLPQDLQNLGGWANPQIIDWFTGYAAVVFSLYADRVKYWITLNEPFSMCDLGYSSKSAPFLNSDKIGRYLCNKHILLAHAKAYRLYEKQYKPQYNGKLSLSNLFLWLLPATPDDQEITDLTKEFWEGRYAHAIYSKKGGWPPKVEQLLAENSKREGYPNSRLPPFTPEEVELVRGTYDFYALNHYTTRVVRKAKPGEEIGEWPYKGSAELGIHLESDPSWKKTATEWFSVYPEGLRSQLHYLNSTYDVKEIIITENGLPTSDDGLSDTDRVDYYKGYLEQILLAIKDGIKVTGYTAWALMDNFEWLSGYGIRYGLYAVNFTDPNRTRTPRESARYYSSIIRSRLSHPDNHTIKLNC